MWGNRDFCSAFRPRICPRICNWLRFAAERDEWEKGGTRGRQWGSEWGGVWWERATRGEPAEEQDLAPFDDNKGAVVFLRKIYAGLISLPVPHRTGGPQIRKRETSWKFLTGENWNSMYFIPITTHNSPLGQTAERISLRNTETSIGVRYSPREHSLILYFALIYVW